MSILDKAKIGNSVQVNLELSKDRLTKEIIDVINVSSVGKICGFRITDEGISYLSPLIQGESYPKYKNGLPAYEQLDLHF